MSITCLAIGDIHIKTSNIDEIDLFTIRIEKLAIERKPTFIVVLGDVLDTMERLHTIALNRACI